jgi:hypothetical protein
MHTFQAFPYHWTINPREEELRGLLQQNNALGLRYSTAIDAPRGCLSYHAILEERAYDIESLSKWARKNIRRGLRNCTVEPISFKFLAGEGWILQQDTLDRQRRGLRRDRAAWERLCLSAAGLPGFEAWGALVQGRLAASVISFPMEDCCYLLYQQCKRDYLAAHVNNALSFIVTQTMVQRPHVRSIFYGLHSLDAPASVDEFKFRMGYVPKPVRQRVVFHHCCSPLVKPLTHTLIRAAKAVQPGNPVLAKAEGMIRFYLEGTRALSKQLTPCFCNSKEQLPATRKLPTLAVEKATIRMHGELQPVSGSSFADEDR